MKLTMSTTSCRSLIDRQSIVSLPYPSPTVLKPLLSFTASSLTKATLIFPLSATVIAAAFALTVDRERLFDYYWKVLLPSFSRMINLPWERTFWNLLILAHAPLQVFSLFLYYAKFSSSSSSRPSTITSFTLILFLVAGAFDLTFLCLLTVVGERESGFLHMIFFICFILSAESFMAAHLLLSSRCGILSFRLRLFLFFSLIITVALLTTAFSLFQGYCVPHSYSTFACLEYCTIAMILTYHSTALLDLDFTMDLVYLGKE